MFWSSVAQAQESRFMPPQATEIASWIDQLYAFLLWTSAISCVLVIGGFIYFAIKYRRKTENDQTAYISHNNVLEFLWSFIPFLIFMAVFGWGWYIYSAMRTMPQGALEVQVIGQKWNWTFMYKSGKKSATELYVPAGQPVKLIMTSKDVIHSFFVPSFRIKQDVVPGHYTSLWFEAKKPGNYQVFCTEYCGDQHSAMLAKVKVLSPEAFAEWLQDDPYKGLSMAAIGEKVFTSRCIACHLPTKEKKIGPGLAGVYGQMREFLDGESVSGDENYIRESILYPNKRIVTGYQKGLMPTFAGQVSEEELMGVIEYIKTLSQ